MKALIFVLLVLSQACVSPSPSPSKCDAKLRAVIDMGSGSTKLNMAETDTCSSAVRINRKIPQDHSQAVALEASKNEKGEISPEAMQAALSALENLRGEAHRWAKKNNFSDFELAVAGTHALRTAANKDEFIRRIEAAGFSVRALTQEEEGLAGFEAANAADLPKDCAKENLLVWDVGGGSTQFTRAAAGGPQTANLSSGAEANRVRMLSLRIHKHDPACPRDPNSPNPMGKGNVKYARNMITRLPAEKVQALNAKKACVVGIGGVHAKAIEAQKQKHWSKVGPCSCGSRPNCLPTAAGYSKKEVQCLAEYFAEKNDCSPELKGPYSFTAASNLTMVLGYMDQLGIDRVFVQDINMGDYFLGDNRLLKFTTETAR